MCCGWIDLPCCFVLCGLSCSCIGLNQSPQKMPGVPCSNDGPPGHKGQTGLPGRNGIDGEPGRPGYNGTDGENGQPGQKGK